MLAPPLNPDKPKLFDQMREPDTDNGVLLNK
jgi:hypothetical protein